MTHEVIIGTLNFIFMTYFIPIYTHMKNVMNYDMDIKTKILTDVCRR